MHTNFDSHKARKDAATMPNDPAALVAVTQEDNRATVELTEWLIINDYFFEDGPANELRAQERFGAFADQLLARHREAAIRATVEDLQPWLKHGGLCGVIGGYDECTCGLEDAIRSLTDMKESGNVEG